MKRPYTANLQHCLVRDFNVQHCQFNFMITVCIHEMSNNTEIPTSAVRWRHVLSISIGCCHGDGVHAITSLSNFEIIGMSAIHTPQSRIEGIFVSKVVFYFCELYESGINRHKTGNYSSFVSGQVASLFPMDIDYIKLIIHHNIDGLVQERHNSSMVRGNVFLALTHGNEGPR